MQGLKPDLAVMGWQRMHPTLLYKERASRHGRIRKTHSEATVMISPKRIFDLGRKAVAAYMADNAMSMGAAIAYYTIFSLAPLLVIVIAVAGALFGQVAVEGQIVTQLGGLIGHEVAVFVQTLLRSASDTGRGMVAGLVSLAVLAIGATTVFAELQRAMDRIWHVPESAKPSGIWALLRTRLLSFGLILGLAFLLMLSL
ncbi:MAG: YihY/virulence factor BrkB family protein, partial [Thiobacillus sp.]|nr:YihY/virulence factor BrkB family protein [Thiobacillus sp.]